MVNHGIVLRTFIHWFYCELSRTITGAMGFNLIFILILLCDLSVSVNGGLPPITANILPFWKEQMRAADDCKGSYYPGWWFGTFSIFNNILGIIIPTDFSYFSRWLAFPVTNMFQRGRPTTNQIIIPLLTTIKPLLTHYQPLLTRYYWMVHTIHWDYHNPLGNCIDQPEVPPFFWSEPRPDRSGFGSWASVPWRKWMYFTIFSMVVGVVSRFMEVFVHGHSHETYETQLHPSDSKHEPQTRLKTGGSQQFRGSVATFEDPFAKTWISYSAPHANLNIR